MVGGGGGVWYLRSHSSEFSCLSKEYSLFVCFFVFFRVGNLSLSPLFCGCSRLDSRCRTSLTSDWFIDCHSLTLVRVLFIYLFWFPWVFHRTSLCCDETLCSLHGLPNALVAWYSVCSSVPEKKNPLLYNTSKHITLLTIVRQLLRKETREKSILNFLNNVTPLHSPPAPYLA